MPDQIEWSGATRELEMLEIMLEKIGDPRIKRDFIQEVAEEALKIVRNQFETSKDPYGKPWAPLVKKKDQLSGRKILKKTGKLKASIKRVLLMDGFKLVSDDPRFSFFQFGTKRMIQRMIFPAEVKSIIPGGESTGGRDLTSSEIYGDIGDKWEVLMQAVLMRVLKKYDIDIFEESGGVAVFEKPRNFRDNY